MCKVKQFIGDGMGIRDMRKGMLAAATLLFFSGVSVSADLPAGYVQDYCRVAGTSNLLLTEDSATLTSEVVRRMDEAVAVANSSEWIYSSRPAFVWASEAKVACGKAYGYLKTNYRDEDYLNKCECFHSRMVEYMN